MPRALIQVTTHTAAPRHHEEMMRKQSAAKDRAVLPKADN
jgi:hypothetical protein